MFLRRIVQLGAASAIILAVLVAWGIWYGITHRIGVARTADESEVSGLPADATDIRWCFPLPTWPNTLYEFSTTREEFEKWVRDKEIQGLQGPDIGPSTIAVYDHGAEEITEREFANATRYSWYEEDEGINMLYDLDAQRAYFFSHTR